MVDLHDRMKQLYWDTPTAERAREIVADKIEKVGLSERQACKLIGASIGINHKYLYQIAGGYVNAGDLTIRKIQSYWARNKRRPAYKKRLVVSFDNDELDLFEELRQLDNEQRKQALKTHYGMLWLKDEI